MSTSFLRPHWIISTWNTPATGCCSRTSRTPGRCSARSPTISSSACGPGSPARPSGKPFIGPDVFVGEGTIIEHGAMIKGPAWIGANCHVRNGCYVRENVIVGDDAVLGNSCEFKNCLLFDGAQVPHFNYVGDSILGYKSHLGAGAILIQRAARPRRDLH